MSILASSGENSCLTAARAGSAHFAKVAFILWGKLWHGKNKRLNCQNFSSNLYIMGETQSAIWNFQLPISCDRVYLQFYINRVLLIRGQNRWWGLRTGVLWWGKHKQEYKKYKTRHCWFWPQILCSWHLPNHLFLSISIFCTCIFADGTTDGL